MRGKKSGWPGCFIPEDATFLFASGQMQRLSGIPSADPDVRNFPHPGSSVPKVSLRKPDRHVSVWRITVLAPPKSGDTVCDLGGSPYRIVMHVSPHFTDSGIRCRLARGVADLPSQFCPFHQPISYAWIPKIDRSFAEYVMFSSITPAYCRSRCKMSLIFCL